VAPQFVAGGIFTLPVLSVILVAFAGGLTSRARQVVQTAASILAIALGLGILSRLGALSVRSRPGIWFIFDATDLAAVAAADIHRRVASVSGTAAGPAHSRQPLSPRQPH
jgi:cytochrome c biogenesis protein CcdA